MRRPPGRTTALAGVALAIVASAAGPAGAVEPDDLPGLVAWYELRSLHARASDGEDVVRLKDASGNAHHLEELATGPAARFRTRRAGGKPALSLSTRSSFAIAEPFELADHTVVLAYATPRPRIGLVRGSTSTSPGIVLHEGDLAATLETPASRVPYARPARLDPGFHVLVLAREDGRLRSWLDGSEISSGARSREPLELAVLFDVALQTRRADAGGLEIAELAIYDRALDDEERHATVDRWLDRYDVARRARPSGIVEERVAVRLRAMGRDDLNGALPRPVRWTAPARIEAPFDAVGPTAVRTRLDGTLARVFVTVPVVSTAEGIDVGVVLRVRGSRSSEIDGATGALGPGETAVVELSGTVLLDAGDVIEVVTVAHGAEGLARLSGDGATLTIENW